jgi:RNase P/RNase MRP subunit p29
MTRDLQFGASVNGVLWAQRPDGEVLSLDADPTAVDAPELYEMRVMTGTVRVGSAPLSWGRIRGVGVNGKVLDDHTLSVRILADDREKVIADQDATLTVSNPSSWPYGLAPEIRTTSQRCAFFKVELTASPPAAEWTTIDAWVAGSDERAPSRNRS